MRQLAYVSIAARPFSKEELISLLEECRANNSRNGITGLLLFRNGHFFQVIEGDEKNIEALFQKIKRDVRHGGILKVMHGDLLAREFPDWSMAFRDLNAATPIEMEGYSKYLNLRHDPSLPNSNESGAKKLLDWFKCRHDDGD